MHWRSSRGQATIGYAIVIGIALIGTVTVVALGATALTDIQTSSGTGAAEQAMTQFDSRTSQVALGDSESQTVSIGQTDGTYEVDPDAGYVRVVHANFDGNATDGDDSSPPGDGDFIAGENADGDEDNDRVLYNSTLGTVRYKRGDTTVGYQSGGVWKKTGDGQATMVSPPEFHYRGSTLTFPIVRVNNETTLPSGATGVQSGSGSVDLRTTLSDESTDIYPTQQDGYPDTDGDGDGFDDAGNGDPYGSNGDTNDGDGDGGYYDNPASNGTVIVYIQSEYYQAWASYFEDRTDGAVDTTAESGGLVGTGFDIDGDGDDEQNVVAVELASTGFSGPFTMPGEGSSLNLQGISDHSLSDFDITLAPDDTDSANFNNLQWSMFVEDGSKQFEMNVRKDTGGNCDNQEFIATIFYSPAGTDDYHGWQKSGIKGECADTDGDGDDETRLTISFIDDDDDDHAATLDHDSRITDRTDSGEDDLEFTYTSLSQSDLTHFGLSGRSQITTATFDEHGSTQGDKDPIEWESRSYSSSSTEYSDGIVNHYFSLLGPGFDLTVDDKNSNTVTEGLSSGRIEYEGGDQFVTYMHISENDVRVRID